MIAKTFQKLEGRWICDVDYRQLNLKLRSGKKAKNQPALTFKNSETDNMSASGAKSEAGKKGKC